MTFNHGFEDSSPSALTKYLRKLSGLQPPSGWATDPGLPVRLMIENPQVKFAAKPSGGVLEQRSCRGYRWGCSPRNLVG